MNNMRIILFYVSERVTKGKMPVQKNPQGSVLPTNNGLASLMSSYGDSSDSGSSSDDETESDSEPVTATKPTAAKTNASNNSTRVVVPEKPLETIIVENNEDIAILGAAQPGLLSFKDANGMNEEDNDNDIEVIGMIHNPESFKEVRVKEEPKSDESSSDTEDSESDSDDSVDQAIFYDAASTVQSLDDELGEGEGSATTKKRQAPRVKGEKGIYDLPPIEDLHISVPHEQCQPVGVIKSVVEPLGNPSHVVHKRYTFLLNNISMVFIFCIIL